MKTALLSSREGVDGTNWIGREDLDDARRKWPDLIQ